MVFKKIILTILSILLLNHLIYSYEIEDYKLENYDIQNYKTEDIKLKDFEIKDYEIKNIFTEDIEIIESTIKNGNIEELDFIVIEDGNLENEINNSDYADILKEVNWKKVGTQFAIGTGIIAVTGVISFAAAGTGNAYISFVFATSSKEALKEAFIGAAIGGILNTAIETIKSGKPINKDAVKYAIEGSAEGYMWGAITGATAGAIKGHNLKKTFIENVNGKNALIKNATGVNSKGHTIITDDLGRLKQVSAKELKYTKDNLRLGYKQREVVKNLGKTTDDGGHLIAREFGGSPDIDNLVPMNRKLNRSGQWRKMEQDIKKFIESGQKVKDYNVTINYIGKSGRPSNFEVSYKVGYKKYIYKILNPS